jgi:hypothetical protein
MSLKVAYSLQFITNLKNVRLFRPMSLYIYIYINIYIQTSTHIVTCRVVLVTIMTGSSSDDWIYWCLAYKFS